MVAVMHRAGRSWRAVAATIRDGKTAILSARAFSAGEVGRVDQWLDQQQAGSVLCVLPSSAVICRNVVLPDASPTQLELALRLQAEAHSQVIAAPHRVAMAVLPAAAGETSRSGIILSWPESASFDGPPTTRPITFVPDVAALAAILNGQRPSEALLWMDRSDGSVAMALTHAGGATFRATRAESGSADEWAQSVERIVAETALSVGHTGGFIEALVGDAQERAASLKPGEAALIVPRELRAAASTRAQGISDDPAWWSSYGVAAGALLARSGQLSSLTNMRQSAPVESPSPVRMALEKLSRPGTAAKVAVACAIILLLGPLAISGLRLQILRWRFGDVQQQLNAVTAARQQFSMYRELQNQNAWPITKLLADITTNAPQGVKLEMIRVEAGKEFAISGTVMAHGQHSPAEVFSTMQDNLQRDGLFTALKPTLEKGSSFNNFKFDLSGKVSKPYGEPTYPEDRDFGKLPLATRMYPDRANAKPGAGNSAEQEPDGGDGTAVAVDVPAEPEEILPDTPEGNDAEQNGDRLTHRTRRGGDSTGGAANPIEQGDATVAPSQDIPPELTQEQIQAMSLPELEEAWARVSRARPYHKNNKELQDRLRREFDMIKDEVIKKKRQKP